MDGDLVSQRALTAHVVWFSRDRRCREEVASGSNLYLLVFISNYSNFELFSVGHDGGRRYGEGGNAVDPAEYWSLMSGETMFKESGSVQVLEGVAAAVVVLLRALDKTRAGMAAEAGLTGSEIRVLFRISEAGWVTPKMLAGSTDLSTGAVTAICDRLVARDVVRRAANPDDRRSLFLKLTGTGETLMERLYGDFRARIGDAQRNMSCAEQELLEAQLLSIAAALGYDLEDGLAGTQTSAVKSV